MPNHAFDHLIIGSTPLAGLVAGLLARQHGRRVCLVADPFSSFGLERQFDLSIDVITRPETLVLLKRLSAETLRLVGGIGSRIIDRVDALFIGEHPQTIAALGHFRHLAHALSYSVERVVDRNIADGTVVRVRGQSLIAHHRFAPALEAWLDNSDVRRLDPDDVTIKLQKDGTAQISGDGIDLDAAQVTLADDEAILRQLPPASWDPAITRQPATALLVQPARPPAQPFSVWLDRGLVLRAEPRGALAVTITGDRDSAAQRLASATPRELPLRRAGEIRGERLATRDAAPLFAEARDTKLTHLVGFGLAAAFYAPAIARRLAGCPTDDEAAWFAARGATRGDRRLSVAEFA